LKTAKQKSVLMYLDFFYSAPVSKGLPQLHELVLPQAVRLCFRDVRSGWQKKFEIFQRCRDGPIERAEERSPEVQHFLSGLFAEKRAGKFNHRYDLKKIQTENWLGQE
jgi:hypothetical protein